MDRTRVRRKLHIGPLSCKFCQLSFSDFHLYHAHTKRHTKRYSKHWLTRSSYKPRTRKRKHTAEDANRQRQHWFMCTDGGVKIRSLATNDQDEISTHYECKVCNRAFSAEIHLTRHERQAHNRVYVPPGEGSNTGADASQANQANGGTVPGDRRRFRCEYCDKRHHNKADLDYHKRTHTGETLVYTCEVCKSTFKRKVYLNRHMRIHNDIRPYVCKICGKSFIKGGGLKEHERTHTGEKPYKCPTCQRGFSGRANLRRHEMTHSGEQPFECEICSKRCNRIASLRQHMRIHTGERPYNCMHCNKAFPTCANLRRHERTHLEKKQFHCRQCGKEFTQKYTLKLHEMNHLGIRPHLCLMCGKTFIEKRKLRQHLQMIHGVAQDADESSDGTSSEPYSLDLALEGNKHLELKNLQPFAGSDFEGAHFKTIKDFQTYWKTAYKDDSGMLDSTVLAQNATETQHKLQEILSRISQNAVINTPTPASSRPRSTPVTAAPVGFQPDLPTLTMTESGIQIIEPGLTDPGQSPLNMTTTSDSSTTNADANGTLLANQKLKPEVAPSTDPEELKIIKKAMKKAKKEAKKEAKKARKDAKRRAKHLADSENPVKDLTKITNVNGSRSLLQPSHEYQSIKESGVDQPVLSIPTFVTSNQLSRSREDRDSTGIADSDKESEIMSSPTPPGNHLQQQHFAAAPNQPIKPQNGNFIFNRFSNMSGSYSCDQCGQTFTSEIVLDIHKKTHNPDEPTSFCIVCSKSFSNANMEDHIKSHDNESQNVMCPSPTPKSTEQFAAMMSNMPNDYIPPLSDISPLSGQKYPVMIAASHGQVAPNKTKRKMHPCQECGKEYVKKSSLTYHMRTHEVGIVPVECVANIDNMMSSQQPDVKPSIDDIPTTTTSNTTEDVKELILDPSKSAEGVASVDNPGQLTSAQKTEAKCLICSDVYTTKGALTTHMEKYHGSLLIQAYADNVNDESATNDNDDNDESHSNDVVEDSKTHPWACNICSKTFPRQEHLAGHMNKHKQFKIKVDTMSEALMAMEKRNSANKTNKHKQEWQCPYCEQKTINKTPLIEHLRGHVGVHRYTCQICYKGFDKKANWTAHQMCHSNELNFECKKCNKKFKHAQSQKKHLIKCKMQYKCDACGHEFRHKRSLNSHVWNTHVRVENCTCKICGKILSSAGGLKEHEMAHTGEKPYMCEICGRGFGNRSNLRRHVMIHDNSRPFVCNFCKMTFNRLASLQQHERCHTGEKPYKCSICDQCFTSKSTRRKHEKRHTQKREISCQFCAKKFWDKYTCRVHERIHTGDLPFECSLCTKKFPERNTLARHMKKKHEEWCAVNNPDNVTSDNADRSSSSSDDDGDDGDDDEIKMEPLSDDEEDYHMSSDTEDGDDQGKEDNEDELQDEDELQEEDSDGELQEQDSDGELQDKVNGDELQKEDNEAELQEHDDKEELQEEDNERGEEQEERPGSNGRHQDSEDEAGD